jgi:anti-sigma B factor antagonist
MVNIEKKDNIDIVTFSTDRIDALNTDEIRARIGKLFENSNAKVIIDLKGIEYIDSSGFGSFLSLFRNARDNYGIIKFAGPEPKIRSLFEILNLHTIFEISDDRESCIRSFR